MVQRGYNPCNNNCTEFSSFIFLFKSKVSHIVARSHPYPVESDYLDPLVRDPTNMNFNHPCRKMNPS